MSYPPPSNPYGPPSYGQPQSPTYGGYSPQSSAVERPSSVTTAVNLMFARVALWFLSTLLSFVLFDDIVGRMPGGAAMQGQATTIGMVFGSLIAVLFMALYGLLAWQVRQGKDWARIVTWIVNGLFIAGAIFGLLMQLVMPGLMSPLVMTLIALVTLAIDIAVVIFLALRPSNAYFSRRPSWQG